MKNNINLLKVLLFISIVMLALILLRYLGIINGEGYKRLSLVDIKDFLLYYGKWSAIIYIIIYGLKPIVLVIPASLLSVVCGILYGPFLGTLYTITGAFIAGTVAFYIARFLGKDAVEKILNSKMAKLDKEIEKNGFNLMLLMRLAIVFPYDHLSYAAGLSKMKYKDFILGTMIGVLPEMTAYNLIGNNIGHPFSKYTIFAIAGVVAIAVTSFFVKRSRDKRLA